MEESRRSRGIRLGVVGSLVVISDYLCYWIGTMDAGKTHMNPMYLVTALLSVVLIGMLATPFRKAKGTGEN